MSAKLVIEFEKIVLAGTPDLYYMHTTVEAESTPDNIRPCLVVQELGGTEPERLARIADFTEIPLLNSISVISMSVSDPILLSPAVGDRYLVKTPGAGAWAGEKNNFATWTGIAWTFIQAYAGMAAWVVDEQLRYVFNGTAWIATPGVGLPELPEDVNYFMDAALPPGIVQVGWRLNMYGPYPPIWTQVMGVVPPGPLEYEVAFILDAPVNKEFLVTPFGATTAFPPTPERNLEVEYFNPAAGPLAPPSVTTVANRDFTGVPGTVYRTSEHYDTFVDETIANNKVNSLRVQAHTLVQETNEDTFTGILLETFE